MLAPLNVLGTPIKPCSTEPMTGWFRDGCCNTDENDHGSHTVCCRVTMPFLEYLAVRGNDLISPAPQHGFPGLKDGDQWCVCAASWRAAYQVGVAAPVVLESTHARALSIVPLEELMENSLGEEA
ncbi:MAG: hypothetical protein CL930_12410 [Deltaproteobacteria bacterium]|jgi:uncharacterized protein (DUF2237 family)|nr:hypothetical protein [Deltaproteobacteria bacterium]